jgi:hypothetical protein
MASQTFRASSSAYVVLSAPWLLIAALWTFASFQTGRVQYAPIAICILAVVLFSAWLASFRLVLSDDTFAYRSLFGGTRRAHYSDVSGVLSTETGVSRLPVRGRVQLATGTDVLINWKVFPAEAVKSFHERIASA